MIGKINTVNIKRKTLTFKSMINGGSTIGPTEFLENAINGIRTRPIKSLSDSTEIQRQKSRKAMYPTEIHMGKLSKAISSLNGLTVNATLRKNFRNTRIQMPFVTLPRTLEIKRIKFETSYLLNPNIFLTEKEIKNIALYAIENDILDLQQKEVEEKAKK